MRLGDDEESRHSEYMKSFKFDLSGKEMEKIRTTWQTGTPLGNAYFREKVEQQLGKKVGQARRGRPYKLNKRL